MVVRTRLFKERSRILANKRIPKDALCYGGSKEKIYIRARQRADVKSCDNVKFYIINRRVGLATVTIKLFKFEVLNPHFCLGYEIYN